MVEKIVEQINDFFAEHKHFPKDFIKAHMNDDGDFCLRIGACDVQLDSKGDFIGCGVDLELLEKFNKDGEKI